MSVVLALFLFFDMLLLKDQGEHIMHSQHSQKKAVHNRKRVGSIRTVKICNNNVFIEIKGLSISDMSVQQLIWGR